MSCEGETLQALKETGHRLTPQRLMILSALRHADTHMTAAQILDQVKESYTYVNVSTVYRTLGVLKSMRLVSETDIGGGERLYEWLDQERHHHLICRECGSLTLLDNKYLEEMGIEVLEEYGFQPDIDHFAISGLCQACRRKAQSLTRES